MTRTERWLLPEGIEELLPSEARRLEALRRRLLDLYATWGYAQVMPPFIEYLESLRVGSGSDLDIETFKLTDQLTGRLMGVRADMTPQVARIEAHRLRQDAPTRLCYLGTVLRTRPDGPGGSRSPLQVGAELYGHAGIESDAEVVALMLETLEACGIHGAHLDLGHVGIFRRLAALAGLDEEGEAELFEILQRKARAELEGALEGLPETHATPLLALVDLNGGDEVVEAARQRLAGISDEIDAALDALAGIAEALRRERPDLVLHFDLAELRGYRYHTGVVFAALLPGHGETVARGGRYDDLGGSFGRARPATGFSADLRTLARLGGTQATAATESGIFAPADSDPALCQTIRALRAAGERVVRALPGQNGGAAEMGCDRELVREGGNWEVRAVHGA
ncbi:MAG: ATP phosphoribosyltransferase regulatory subunit [Gammaproteobacteria bacterium]|nr:ATP phosphoribosyltransferase regulatory subunit [Gammaproteobacteria bacterium]